MAALIIAEILPHLHEDAKALVMHHICGPKAGSLNLADARLTLHTILGKISARNETSSHLYWPSLVAAVALLSATDIPRLENSCPGWLLPQGVVLGAGVRHVRISHWGR